MKKLISGAKINSASDDASGLAVSEKMRNQITASKSRIMDTDMAEEITEYTKNNIISQSSQSMLAQANVHMQDVLSLLKQE